MCRADEADLGSLPAQRKFPVVRRFMRNKLAVAGLVIIVILYGLAIIGPSISPYPYDQINAGMSDKPPSAEHLLGTDRSSRDTLSRLLKGGQFSLAAGFAAVAIVLTIGVALGALAGFFGRRSSQSASPPGTAGRGWCAGSSCN